MIYQSRYILANINLKYGKNNLSFSIRSCDRKFVSIFNTKVRVLATNRCIHFVLDLSFNLVNP